MKHSDGYGAIEDAAFNQAAQTMTIEDRAKTAETLKNIAEARNVARSSHHQRVQFWGTAVAPFLALLVTAATLLFQNHQFQQQLKSQGEQFAATAAIQRDTSEDAQWREALKSVSLADPKSSLLGAFAMQGFFGSPRYGSQAREIAGTLLTNVANVDAFDEIVTSMRDKTTSSNIKDISGLAQMLGYAQRARYHMNGEAFDANAPFLIVDVDEIDPNPANFEHNEIQRTKIAAWELDTVSQALNRLWTAKDGHHLPEGLLLTGVVLENGTFDEVSFAGANLNFGILYHASFKNAIFTRAKFKGTLVAQVSLDGADFSGVTEFANSKWKDANWWDAKCIPEPMLAHLQSVAPHSLSPEAKSRLTSSCR